MLIPAAFATFILFEPENQSKNTIWTLRQNSSNPIQFLLPKRQDHPPSPSLHHLSLPFLLRVVNPTFEKSTKTNFLTQKNGSTHIPNRLRQGQPHPLSPPLLLQHPLRFINRTSRSNHQWSQKVKIIIRHPSKQHFLIFFLSIMIEGDHLQQIIFVAMPHIDIIVQNHRNIVMSSRNDFREFLVTKGGIRLRNQSRLLKNLLLRIYILNYLQSVISGAEGIHKNRKKLRNRLQKFMQVRPFSDQIFNFSMPTNLEIVLQIIKLLHLTKSPFKLLIFIFMNFWFVVLRKREIESDSSRVQDSVVKIENQYHFGALGEFVDLVLHQFTLGGDVADFVEDQLTFSLTAVLKTLAANTIKDQFVLAGLYFEDENLARPPLLLAGDRLWADRPCYLAGEGAAQLENLDGPPKLEGAYFIPLFDGGALFSLAAWPHFDYCTSWDESLDVDQVVVVELHLFLFPFFWFMSQPNFWRENLDFFEFLPQTGSIETNQFTEMEMKPRKMWTTVRSEPKDKYRNTIFATRKNIKDQFANMNGKRWKQDIIDQNSYMFAWNNPKHDRSIGMAPTQKMRVERYMAQHNNPHKQRDTVFSTPTVLNSLTNYKRLESKKHYINIYNSSSMQGVMDYQYPDTKYERKKGKASIRRDKKNASSVGNPILLASRVKKAPKKTQGRKRGQFSTGLYQTTGNFKPDDPKNQIRVTEYNSDIKNPARKLASLETGHIFRKQGNTIEGITRQLMRQSGFQGYY